MSVESELHPMQTAILRTLLFAPQARFAQLNTLKVSTDHFTFHLKRLITIGLVEKQGPHYALTTTGKETANRLDTITATFEKQAKVGVLVVAVRQHNGHQEFLVQKRLKQPYYGFHGFVTGKVHWSETLTEAAARELQEETELAASMKLVGIKHKMDYNPQGQILEDKYFFVFRASWPSGKLVFKFEGGENLWLTRKEILSLPQLFDGVEETLKMVQGNRLLFAEDKYTVSRY